MESCTSLTGDRTTEQLDWLDNQTDPHPAALQHEDPSSWLSVYEDLLSLWPIHWMLWPSMPDSQCLTRAEKDDRVCEAKDRYKSVSIFSIQIFKR